MFTMKSISTMEYDADAMSGLMPQIRALTAPPGQIDAKPINGNESSNGNGNQTGNGESARGLAAHPYFKRPGKGHNHDSCDACGEVGDLICCDLCPASFHLCCHDPPLEEEDIPEGDWSCHQCRVAGKKTQEKSTNGTQKTIKQQKASEEKNANGSQKNTKQPKVHKKEDAKELKKVWSSGREIDISQSPFLSLVKSAASTNPKEFALPNELKLPVNFPGEPKDIRRNGNKKGSLKKKPWELQDNGITPRPAITCHLCSKSCRVGPLLPCDYCPLYFHLDCLDPPLTIPPQGKWMCPGHPEQYLDTALLTSHSLTERVKLWDKFSGPVNEHSIKLDFLRKCREDKVKAKYRIKKVLRSRVNVPVEIKAHYYNPPELLPHLSRSQFVPYPPAITQHQTVCCHDILLTSDEDKLIQSSKSNPESCEAVLTVEKASTDVEQSNTTDIEQKRVIEVEQKEAKEVEQKAYDEKQKEVKDIESTDKSDTQKVDTIDIEQKMMTDEQIKDLEMKEQDDSIVKDISVSDTTMTESNDCNDKREETKDLKVKESSDGIFKLKEISSVNASLSENKNIVKNQVSDVHYSSNGNSKMKENASAIVNKTVENRTTDLKESRDVNSKMKVNASAIVVKTVENQVTDLKESSDDNSKMKQITSVNASNLPNNAVENQDTDVLEKFKELTEIDITIKECDPRPIGVKKAIPEKLPPPMMEPIMKPIIALSNIQQFGLRTSDNEFKNVKASDEEKSEFLKGIICLQSEAAKLAAKNRTNDLHYSDFANGIQENATATPARKRKIDASNTRLSRQRYKKQKLSKVDMICESLNTIKETLKENIEKKAGLILEGLDKDVMQLLAFERIESLFEKKEPKKQVSYEDLPVKALLCPLVPDISLKMMAPEVTYKEEPAPMMWNVIEIGKGSHNHVNLDNYGYCNFISGDHASIFYDVSTGLYEIINNSEHGTFVDGVTMAFCFRESTLSNPGPTTMMQEIKELVDAKLNRPPKTKPILENIDAGKTISPCNCRKPISQNCYYIDKKSGEAVYGGVENSVILHHGSYIKFGCLQFVFSIIEEAQAADCEEDLLTTYTNFIVKEEKDGKKQNQSDSD